MSVQEIEESRIDFVNQAIWEETIKISEQKYRNLIENAPVGITISNRDGSIVEINKARLSMVGYDSKEEYLKVPVSERYRDLNDRKRWIEEVLKNGKVEDFEIQLRRKDGTLYWVLMNSIPQKSETGEQQFVIVTQDITERKRTEQELLQSQEQLRNLSEYIESTRETERTTIAREIHDELGQALTALKMDIAWLKKRMSLEPELAKKSEEMSKLIDTTIQTVKRISTELRPGVLDDLGLTAAIQWQMREFQERTGIKCELIAEAIVENNQKLDTAVFRILQEALTNIARHANATRVKVSLEKTNGQLELQVTDNGKGITKEQIADPKSLGLIGINERALSWGGNFTICGCPSSGTSLIVKIPLKLNRENKS